MAAALDTKLVDFVPSSWPISYLTQIIFSNVSIGKDIFRSEKYTRKLQIRGPVSRVLARAMLLDGYSSRAIMLP